MNSSTLTTELYLSFRGLAALRLGSPETSVGF